MTEMTNNRVLRVTKMLVYLIMGAVALVGALLAVVSIVLPIYWMDALAKVAETNPGLNQAALLPNLLAVFALGVVVLGLIWTIMRKLLAIISSVEVGDPFAIPNARRLRAIGWLMVAIQLVGIPLAFAAGAAADLFGESDTGPDVSVNGILAILLVFILAGIFEYGAEMREELEGTV